LTKGQNKGDDNVFIIAPKITIRDAYLRAITIYSIHVILVKSYQNLLNE